MENHGLEQLDKPGGSRSVVPYIVIALLVLVILILLLVFFLSPDSINGLRSSISSPALSPPLRVMFPAKRLIQSSETEDH